MEVSQGSERMREKRGNDFAGASLNKIRGSGASWGRIRGEFMKIWSTKSF